MAGSDLVLGQARLAYERGRARRAALAVAPLALVVLAAGMMGSRPMTACVLGCLLLPASATLLWRGQALGRAVMPSVLAGLIPLGLALAAKAYGHVCTGDECVSLCMPACATGGLIAGGVLAWLFRRGKLPRSALLAGGGVALLTGALGCSCAGYGGVLGLLGGLLVFVLPAALRARPAQ